MSVASDYANNTARILAELGQSQAQAAAAKGAIWGNAIGQIGQIAAQVPQEMRREQLTQSEIASANQQRLINDMRIKADQQANQHAQDWASFLMQTAPQFTKPTANGGFETDYEAMKPLAMQGGFTEDLNKLADAEATHRSHLDVARSNALALQQKQRELSDDTANRLARVASGIKSPVEFTNAIYHAVSSGLLQPEEGMHYVAQGLTSTETGQPGWQQITQHFVQSAPASQDAAAAAQASLKKPVVVHPGEGFTTQEDINAGKPPTVPIPAAGPAPSIHPGLDAQGNPTFLAVTPQGAVPIPGGRPQPPAASGSTSNDVINARDMVAGMKEGTIPPLPPGRATKEYAQVMAEAKRQGYDLASANLDWEATKKHLLTLNGTQQLRLQQAIGTASESLNVIEDLAKQWDGGKFPLLNKATLAIAKNGGLGPKAQEIATNLEAQIGDVASELGNVYMGGNSPTDVALGLASKNLNASWTRDQLLSAVKLARTNLQIRQNSIKNAGVQGASADNPYARQQGGSTTTKDVIQNGVTYTVTLDSNGNVISSVKKGG